MPRFLLFLLTAFLIGTVTSPAAGEWTGTWDTQLRGGSVRLQLEQNGDRVTGQYPLYNGRIEAETQGRRLEGRWIEGEQSGSFVFALSRDGRSFAGRYNNGEWWTGERASQPVISRVTDRRSPRNAFTNFVVAGNLARGGMHDAWGVAATSVDFGAAAEPMTRAEQIDLTRALFGLIDLTTFRIWSIPDNPAAASIEVRLEQPRSDAHLTLTMRRDRDGDWRILLPTQIEMAAARKALLAVHGGKLPAADAFRRLQNPRDTMRAFLEGMADWNGDGRALALAALDLSGVPQLLHESQGALVAQYLRRSLDHIGLVGLQSIPDAGNSREAYVHFVHPMGRIVIAPTGTGSDATWQFTAKTVADIQNLYAVIETLPPPLAVPPGLIPEDTFFTLHNLTRTHAPLLIERLGLWEYWQILAVLIALALASVVSFMVASLVCSGIRRIPGAEQEQSRAFLWALTLALIFVFMHRVPILIGVPGATREYSVPVVGIVACLTAGFAAWHLLRVFGGYLAALAERTSVTTDDIVVTLALAGARLGVVIATSLGIAHFLSIPTSNILAGLGIGGLAFAFASRETLSNVFGAGILVSDRPFRRGDWIKTSEVEGAVEEVGIRSTRLRTAQDSVVVVPNGKLADSTIDNQGSRRLRLVKIRLLVTEGGTPEKLLCLIAALRQRIAGDAAFEAARTAIVVSGIAPEGIEMEMTSYLNVGSKSAEIAARHELLIDTLRLAEHSGLKLGQGMKDYSAPDV